MSYNFRKNRGFTLVELLVCISIIAVLAVVLLGNRSRYSERLILKNQTYNMALYLRQAQVYSLAVKGSGSPTTFSTSYGVHFSADNPPNQFKFFTDENGNDRFDGGEQNEDITLSNNITIQSVCGNNGSDCYATTGNFQMMSITFKRPASAARMRFMNYGGNLTGGVNPPAVITLRSQTGLTSSIKVDSTGGISIQGI